MKAKTFPLICFGRPLPNACLYLLENGEYAVYWKQNKIATICRKRDGMLALCEWFEGNGQRSPI